MNYQIYPILKNQCFSPKNHSEEEPCNCSKTKWFTSKELWNLALYFDYINIYPSKKIIKKIVFLDKSSTLFKSQLVTACIKYGLYDTVKIAFSKTKKELIDSILEFIKTNILLCNELCYLGIPKSLYWTDWDKWHCEMCRKEYTYLSSLSIRSGCSDDNVFGDRCCVKVVCKPANELCTYINPEYRY